ncbi:hypothetical protein [Dongia sp. agr-C8]
MGDTFFPFYLERLETVLSEMKFGQPSALYLAIALVASVNATVLWYSLRDTERFAWIGMFAGLVARVHRVILWIGFAYIVLRFPLMAFAAPPLAFGHTLFGMVMYSLLFAPLWVGLVILAWTMTRRCHYRGVPSFRARRAAIVLAVICWWGSIGEFRVLLDPALLRELSRFPM